MSPNVARNCFDLNPDTDVWRRLNAIIIITERERENTEYGNCIRQGYSPIWRGVNTINLIIQCTHNIQVADVGMLQMSKAEAKPYVEENSYNYTFLLRSSASSCISHNYLLQVLHDSKAFLLLNALYTNKARFFRARSFCVAFSVSLKQCQPKFTWVIAIFGVYKLVS